MWRHAIVLVLALPGAFFGGVWGFLIGSFAGDASPHPFIFTCLVAGLVAAGIGLGALPGLLTGILLHLRWVIPVLGTGLGALTTGVLIVAAQGLLTSSSQFSGLTALIVGIAILVPIAIGLVIGAFCYRAAIKKDLDRQHTVPAQPAEAVS